MTAAIIIFIGGLLSVLGVFIAARQAINDSEELDKKNKKIIELTEENARLSKQALDQITGGTSWAYVKSGLDFLHGIVDQPSIWTINVVGEIPLYDVSVVISEISHDNTLPTKSYKLTPILSKEFGTVTPSLHPDHVGLITLPKNKKRTEFQVKIKARNGEITQHIIFIKKDDGHWTKAEKVFRYRPTDKGGFKKEVLSEKINDDFPDKQHVLWIEI
ncbi:MAG TPA: hypothetical protein VGQ59_04220 [Cyclobacteriaceae bacterium]|nr:hypothetical protein [Cyclobacteriaceae bacterium]